MSPVKRRQTQRRRRSGGSLFGAPLSYTMTPGSTVNVYGHFPTEIASDAKSIQDLDVYYRSALSQGCGTENSSRQVPTDMGSNRVPSQAGGSASFLNLDRPFLAGTPPNTAQSTMASWSGATEPVPIPSSPVYQAWGYQSQVMPQVINPTTFVSALPPSPMFATWRGGKRRGTRKSRTTRKTKTHRRRRSSNRA